VRPTWVVGAGGLLGSHLTAALGPAAWSGPRIAWAAHDAPDQLRLAARAFRTAAGDAPWQVAWCAGAGVTATGPEALAREVAALEAVLDGLGDPAGGRLFLSSSAGGVYAGSVGPPFDEHTPPQPLAPYGGTKLQMEALAASWAGPVVLGRIANLYGPGQDVAKPQGLISQLCRAHLLRQPLQVYVPLDTVRDYLYVEDAARLVLGCLDRADGVTVKVLASQQAITIGAVLAELRRVSRRAPRLVLSASAQARVQARDLRLRSRVWTDLDRVPLTPFPVGVKRTLDDLSLRLRAGRLA
jgi:UDP-glucose 4-epimerase